MKMPFGFKKSFQFAALLLLATCYLSCHEVYFEQPQPMEKRALNKIPSKIRGLYAEEKDTIEVTATSVKGLADDDYILNQGLVVKKFKGYYFFNFKEKDNGYWQVYLVKPYDGEGLQLYTLAMDEEADRAEVRKITPVRTTFDSDGNEDDYFLNPSKREWKKLFERGLIRTDSKDGVIQRMKGD